MSSYVLIEVPLDDILVVLSDVESVLKLSGKMELLDFFIELEKFLFVRLVTFLLRVARSGITRLPLEDFFTEYAHEGLET